MSTRATIIIRDQYDELCFYRHSDGYPECCGESLKVFLGWVQRCLIRDNVEQASGWLVLLGAMEYKTLNPEAFAIVEPNCLGSDYKVRAEPHEWKCGAYEPATGIHGDIDYLYVIDLKAKTLQIDGENGFRYSGKFERPD